MTDEDGFDPMDVWRRRRRFSHPFFDLADIDEDMERMHRYMDALFRSALSSPIGQEDPEEGKKYVYGFSLRMGPDGKPIIQEFGNTKPAIRTPGISEPPGLTGVREPLIDIIDCQDSIAITAELPGVEKENLNLMVNRKSVIIEARASGVTYYKEIPLVEEVYNEKAAATYKNGILDVQIPKASKNKEQGHKVDIE